MDPFFAGALTAMADFPDLSAVLASIPDIIRAAAESPRGIVALLIIVVAGAGLIFFYKQDPKYRIAVFLLLFAGSGVFSLQLIRSQRDLTRDNLVAAYHDSLDAARRNPRISEFNVRLTFPPKTTIPAAVESFIQPRRQAAFSRVDSVSVQRTDNPQAASVSMTYLGLPEGAVLKIIAKGERKTWNTQDITIPAPSQLEMLVKR